METEEKNKEKKKKGVEGKTDLSAELEKKHKAEDANLQKKQRWRKFLRWVYRFGPSVLGAATFITTFIILVIAYRQFKINKHQFELAQIQFESTQEATERLIAQLERLDEVMGDVSSSANELNISLPIIVARIKASLGELSFVLENLQVNIDKSYELLMEAEQVQNEVTQNIHEAQKLIQRDISRKPLVVLTANDIWVEPLDSLHLEDSVYSVNFKFVNYGDRTTEGPRAFITLPDGYKVVDTQGDVRIVSSDSNLFRVYCSQKLYWADPDMGYGVSINERVRIMNTKGSLHNVVIPLATIYSVERQPYTHGFRIDKVNSGDYLPIPFIESELDSIRARQEAKPK